MENLYALDETLDLLNGTNLANIDLYMESVFEEMNNFDKMLVTEDVKDVAGNIKETIKKLIEKIKVIITNLTNKIKSKVVDKMCDKIKANIEIQRKELAELDGSIKISVTSAMGLSFTDMVFSNLPSGDDIVKYIDGEIDLNDNPIIYYKSIIDALKKFAKLNNVTIRLSWGIANKAIKIPEEDQLSVSEYKNLLDNIEEYIKTVPEDLKNTINEYKGLQEVLNKAYSKVNSVEEKSELNAMIKAATKTMNLYSTVISGMFKALNGAMACTNRSLKSLAKKNSEEK